MKRALAGWGIASVAAVTANLLWTRNAPLLEPSNPMRHLPVQLRLPFES